MVGSTNTVVQKRIILCLFWARQCCLFMCVFYVLNFTNCKIALNAFNFPLFHRLHQYSYTKIVILCLPTWLSFHVCNDCVLFDKYKIVLIAFKLLLFHVAGSVNTVAQKRVIRCLPRARRCCLFMCVLNK